MHTWKFVAGKELVHGLIKKQKFKGARVIQITTSEELRGNLWPGRRPCLGRYLGEMAGECGSNEKSIGGPAPAPAPALGTLCQRFNRANDQPHRLAFSGFVSLWSPSLNPFITTVSYLISSTIASPAFHSGTIASYSKVSSMWFTLSQSLWFILLLFIDRINISIKISIRTQNI